MRRNTLIIIPAHNESRNILNVLSRIPETCFSLVVDDASTDNTSILLQNHKIEYIKNQVKLGVSGSILNGVKFAKDHHFTHVICIDADGQHDPFYLDSFFSALQRADFVCANRFSDINNIPTSKLASNSLASKLVKQYLNVSHPDVSCGFRAFRVDSFFEHLNTISLQNYEAVYDLLFFAVLSKLRVATVNIPSIYYPNELWCTRRNELTALLSSLYHYAKSATLNHHLSEIEKRPTNYSITTDGTQYHLHYLPSKDAFLIQASVHEIKKYYEGFHLAKL